MTGNPHPDHGPLWVERDSDGRVTVWTEDVHGDPYAIMTRTGEQADAIEAQITPLPDGVYRDGKGDLWLAAQFPVPVGGQVQTDGHGWMGRMGNIPASHSNRRFRRIPAEPPAPPTEDVPLHELCGRKLPVALWVVQSVRIAGRHIYAFDTLNPFEATISHPVTLNPDGTVTVQRETAPDGTS